MNACSRNVFAGDCFSSVQLSLSDGKACAPAAYRIAARNHLSAKVLEATPIQGAHSKQDLEPVDDFLADWFGTSQIHTVIVGVLRSLLGTMVIDEINANGGVPDMKLEPLGAIPLRHLAYGRMGESF